MNTIDHVPPHSWEFGSGPGDDTVLMDAADAVLNLQPSRITFVPHSRLSRETAQFISDRDLTQFSRTPNECREVPAQQVSEPYESPTHRLSVASAKKPSLTKGSPPQPETPLPRPRSTPSSSLSDDVDKVIRYLDTFRANHSTRITKVTDENKLGNRFGGDRSFGRQKFLVVNTVLSDATNNGLDALEDVRKMEGAESIFRDASFPVLASPFAPTIYKANSIHSLQRNTPSPVTCTPRDDLDVDAVANLINSMCVENEAMTLDWTVLDKIQRKVEELLREARKQREATDEWVKAVQDSVDQWVNEQRLLIDIERRQARDRALQQGSSPTSRETPVKTIGHVSVASQRNLYVIIDQQAKKIKELELRFAKEKASHAPIPALKTPRYVQISDPQRSDSDSRFFDMVEELESPTLPHIVNKQVRPKREYLTLESGCRVIKFRNGSEREYLSDGTLITRYPNGDVKTESQLDSIVTYWHAAEQTKQTIFPDGVHVYEYPNKQVERHFTDGRKEVTHATGSRLPNGTGVSAKKGR